MKAIPDTGQGRRGHGFGQWVNGHYVARTTGSGLGIDVIGSRQDPHRHIPRVASLAAPVEPSQHPQ